MVIGTPGYDTTIYHGGLIPRPRSIGGTSTASSRCIISCGLIPPPHDQIKESFVYFATTSSDWPYLRSSRSPLHLLSPAFSLIRPDSTRPDVLAPSESGDGEFLDRSREKKRIVLPPPTSCRQPKTITSLGAFFPPFLSISSPFYSPPFSFCARRSERLHIL